MTETEITHTLALARTALRREVYQEQLKTDAALTNGVPFDTYFYLPYAEWAEIRSAHLAEYPTDER